MVSRPVASACRCKKCTKAGSSIAGLVSGRAASVVMPPATAAEAAESIVSRYSNPGYPIAARIYTRPGKSTEPWHSTTSAPSGRPRLLPRSRISPSRTKSSPGWSSPLDGSRSRAPVNSRSAGMADGSAGQRVQHRHAYGNAHFDLLFNNAALRVVCDAAVDFHAAVHRPRVHHQCFRACVAEFLFIQPPEAEVFARARHKVPLH